MRVRIGMLSTRVRRDTRIMKTGSEGGSVMVHCDDSLFQVHCVAPDSILEGISIHDAYIGNTAEEGRSERNSKEGRIEMIN
jgi:hypothetical protein